MGGGGGLVITLMQLNYDQGLIEPPKAARGHATSNADSVDREI